ncbi:MAG: hypothetical protein F6K11_20320 [Leptolyngbya sp. SIO3F4]|nr:hypothetical protein [Leptolyngbya sp. SIO3F4]
MSRDALIVGINSYRYLPQLKAPIADAEAIAQCLKQDGKFQIQRIPERTLQASENKPSVSVLQTVSQLQLERALRQLFRPGSSQAPETALFYFSGHGIPDEDGFDQGCLATSDTDPKNPRSGLSLRWLQWLLSESQVKQQIIWLDCCHSGSLIVNVKAANLVDSKNRSRCFIASSRGFENSWEDSNSEYSVLTKALLEGLDPSRLPGQWIDTFSLVDYVNQALKGELQTPVCNNFGKAINLTQVWQEIPQGEKYASANKDEKIVDEAHKVLVWRRQLLQQRIEKKRDLQQQRIKAGTVASKTHNQSKGALSSGLSSNQILQFQKQTAKSLPSLNTAKRFIRKRIWRRRWNFLIAACWLIVPSVVLGGAVEHAIRETNVKSHYGRLESENKSLKKQAVQTLVAGCSATSSYSVIPKYFSERVFGHCRSLEQVSLSTVDLSRSNLRDADFNSADLNSANLNSTEFNSADLRYVDLYDADLRFADLRDADLRSARLSDADLRDANLHDANLRDAKLINADLSKANLSFADLINADLSGAKLHDTDLRYAVINANLSDVDLSDTDLRYADFISVDLTNTNFHKADLRYVIFLATDLRATKNLTEKQLEGASSIYICNSLFPDGIEIAGGKDRDCDKLADILHKRYPNWFKSLDAAEEFVEEQQQKSWK